MRGEKTMRWLIETFHHGAWHPRDYWTSKEAADREASELRALDYCVRVSEVKR